MQFCGLQPPGSSVHGISRQEYWSGLPFPAPGSYGPRDGIHVSYHWQAGSLPPSHQRGPQYYELTDPQIGPGAYPEAIENDSFFISDLPAFIFCSFLNSPPATSTLIFTITSVGYFVSILNLYNHVGDQNSSINVHKISLKWQYTYHRLCSQSYVGVQAAREETDVYWSHSQSKTLWRKGFLILVCIKITEDTLQKKLFPTFYHQRFLFHSQGSRGLEYEYLVSSPPNKVILMLVAHAPHIKKGIWETSLVVQGIRLLLQMQGTQVQSLLWEDSTCCRAAKPVCHSYWDCALEPVSCHGWARGPRTWGSSFCSRSFKHLLNSTLLEKWGSLQW